MIEFEELSDTELRYVLEQSAQEQTRRLLIKEGTNENPEKANFPWGYIRRIDDLRERWPYLTRGRQRTVACMLQLCDINRWILNTWNIGLTAGSCFEWHCTLPIIAVSELLLAQFGRQNSWFTKSQKVQFSKAIDKFKEMKVIDNKLHAALHELRTYRDTIHLERMKKVECFDGQATNYNLAVKTLEDLESALYRY